MYMELLIVSFIAGVLTVLAPCVLPILPVILSGSLGSRSFWRPFTITATLALSIIAFTLLLKSTTLLIQIHPDTWKFISGGIIFFFGVITLFPEIWEKLSFRFGFGSTSQTALQKAGQKSGFVGNALLGAALGPVFASCSPTYFFIVATVLPAGFVTGLINLFAYGIGLAFVLFLIAYFGQTFVSRAKWAADPHGWFRRILGIILILVGIAILTGADKKLEAYLVSEGFGNTKIEERLLEGVKQEQPKITTAPQADNGAPFSESMAEQIFASFGLQTNTALRSIPLDEVLGGGPPKDGIPALTEPEYVSAEDIDLAEDARGIFVNIAGDARFYPYRIMYFHEIVNDVIGGIPVAITFCPLCGSAIVYDRRVDGDVLEFGVSGKLWESNLLMYDTETESLWSQIRGEAMVGDMLGKMLTVVNSDVVRYGDMNDSSRFLKILSENTGYNRDYSDNPYSNYEQNEELWFEVSNTDARFPTKDIFFIVEINGISVGFHRLSLIEAEVAEVAVEGKTITAQFDENRRLIVSDENGETIPGYNAMWFSWITHQDGEKVVWPFVRDDS